MVSPNLMLLRISCTIWLLCDLLPAMLCSLSDPGKVGNNSTLAFWSLQVHSGMNLHTGDFHKKAPTKEAIFTNQWGEFHFVEFQLVKNGRQVPFTAKWWLKTWYIWFTYRHTLNDGCISEGSCGPGRACAWGSSWKWMASFVKWSRPPDWHFPRWQDVALVQRLQVGVGFV